MGSYDTLDTKGLKIIYLSTDSLVFFILLTVIQSTDSLAFWRYLWGEFHNVDNTVDPTVIRGINTRSEL